VEIAADQASGDIRLQASTNLQTWTDLNLGSAPVFSTNFFNRCTFSFSPKGYDEYYRLEEP
jgi:hypothetical protein